MARSVAQAVRGASGMVTTLPPLRVTVSSWNLRRAGFGGGSTHEDWLIHDRARFRDRPLPI